MFSLQEFRTATQNVTEFVLESITAEEKRLKTLSNVDTSERVKAEEALISARKYVVKQEKDGNPVTDLPDIILTIAQFFPSSYFCQYPLYLHR